VIFGIEEATVQLWLLNCLMAYSAYLATTGGSFSFAYVAFIAIGAYTAGILTTQHGLVFWQVLIIAPLIAGAVAVVLARILERLSGIYLAIASVSLVGLLQGILINWTSLTGGPIGISGIPIEVHYWELFVGVAILALLMRQLQYSDLGRAIQMMRLDPLVAGSLGVNVPRTRLLLFIASAVVGAIAGVFSAQYYGFIAPPTYGFELIVQLLAMVVIGGLGSWVGVPIGAAIFTLLPRWLESFGAWTNLVTGALLLVIVILSREGIAGAVSQAWYRWRVRARLGGRGGSDPMVGRARAEES
jgi:branched-chain amino acid transport system permease protein